MACFFAVDMVVWIWPTALPAYPTLAFIDNSSARQLAYNSVHHQRSKHVDIKYHWIRDMVADHTVKLVHVTTTEQRADFLTKTLPGATCLLSCLMSNMHAWFSAVRIRPV